MRTSTLRQLINMLHGVPAVEERALFGWRFGQAYVRFFSQLLKDLLHGHTGPYAVGIAVDMSS